MTFNDFKSFCADNKKPPSAALDVLAQALHHYLSTTRAFKPLSTSSSSWTHDKSSLEFTFTPLLLSPSQILFAAAVPENSATCTLDPRVFICAKFDYAAPGAVASDAFESPDAYSRFIAHMRELVERVAPGLDKDSAVPPPPPPTTTTTDRSNAQPPPLPGRFPNPTHPSFGREDDYLFPFGIGDRDLDPFAGAHPSRSGNPLFVGGGSGMIVGPDHPMFQGRGGIPMSQRPGGAQGLPPHAVPPGARFGMSAWSMLTGLDPVGPFGPRPPFPGGGRGGRGVPGMYGGDPDNDEYIPQGGFGGNDDMYM